MFYKIFEYYLLYGSYKNKRFINRYYTRYFMTSLAVSRQLITERFVQERLQGKVHNHQECEVRDNRQAS